MYIIVHMFNVMSVLC